MSIVYKNKNAKNATQSKVLRVTRKNIKEELPQESESDLTIFFCILYNGCWNPFLRLKAIYFVDFWKIFLTFFLFIFLGELNRQMNDEVSVSNLLSLQCIGNKHWKFYNSSESKAKQIDFIVSNFTGNSRDDKLIICTEIFY